MDVRGVLLRITLVFQVLLSYGQAQWHQDINPIQNHGMFNNGLSAGGGWTMGSPGVQQSGVPFLSVSPRQRVRSGYRGTADRYSQRSKRDARGKEAVLLAEVTNPRSHRAKRQVPGSNQPQASWDFHPSSLARSGTQKSGLEAMRMLVNQLGGNGDALPQKSATETKGALTPLTSNMNSNTVGGKSSNSSQASAAVPRPPPTVLKSSRSGRRGQMNASRAQISPGNVLPRNRRPRRRNKRPQARRRPGRPPSNVPTKAKLNTRRPRPNPVTPRPDIRPIPTARNPIMPPLNQPLPNPDPLLMNQHTGHHPQPPIKQLQLRQPIHQSQNPPTGLPRGPQLTQDPAVGVQPHPPMRLTQDPQVGVPRPPPTGKPPQPPVDQPQNPPLIKKPLRPPMRLPPAGMQQQTPVNKPQDPLSGMLQQPPVNHIQDQLMGMMGMMAMLQQSSENQPQNQLTAMQQQPKVNQPQNTMTGMQQQPSAHQPQNPMTGMQQQPSAYQPQNPMTGMQQQPSAHQPQNPMTGMQQQPSAYQPKNLMTGMQQQPSAYQPQNPMTGMQQQPHAHQPQNPMTGMQQQPSAYQPQNPMTGMQQQPSAHQPQNPMTGMQPQLPVQQSQNTMTGMQQQPLNQPQNIMTGMPQQPVHQSQNTTAGVQQQLPVPQPQHPMTRMQQPPYVHQAQNTMMGMQQQPLQRQPQTSMTGMQPQPPAQQSQNPMTAMQQQLPVHQLQNSLVGVPQPSPADRPQGPLVVMSQQPTMPPTIGPQFQRESLYQIQGNTGRNVMSPNVDPNIQLLSTNSGRRHQMSQNNPSSNQHSMNGHRTNKKLSNIAPSNKPPAKQQPSNAQTLMNQQWTGQQLFNQAPTNQPQLMSHQFVQQPSNNPTPIDQVASQQNGQQSFNQPLPKNQQQQFNYQSVTQTPNQQQSQQQINHRQANQAPINQQPLYQQPNNMQQSFQQVFDQFQPQPTHGPQQNQRQINQHLQQNRPNRQRAKQRPMNQRQKGPKPLMQRGAVKNRMTKTNGSFMNTPLPNVPVNRGLKEPLAAKKLWSPIGNPGTGQPVLTNKPATQQQQQPSSMPVKTWFKPKGLNLAFFKSTTRAPSPVRPRERAFRVSGRRRAMGPPRQKATVSPLPTLPPTTASWWHMGVPNLTTTTTTIRPTPQPRRNPTPPMSVDHSSVMLRQNKRKQQSFKRSYMRPAIRNIVRSRNNFGNLFNAKISTTTTPIPPVRTTPPVPTTQRMPVPKHRPPPKRRPPPEHLRSKKRRPSGRRPKARRLRNKTPRNPAAVNPTSAYTATVPPQPTPIPTSYMPTPKTHPNVRPWQPTPPTPPPSFNKNTYVNQGLFTTTRAPNPVTAPVRPRKQVRRKPSRPQRPPRLNAPKRPPRRRTKPITTAVPWATTSTFQWERITSKTLLRPRPRPTEKPSWNRPIFPTRPVPQHPKLKQTTTATSNQNSELLQLLRQIASRSASTPTPPQPTPPIATMAPVKPMVPVNNTQVAQNNELMTLLRQIANNKATPISPVKNNTNLHPVPSNNIVTIPTPIHGPNTGPIADMGHRNMQFLVDALAHNQQKTASLNSLVMNLLHNTPQASHSMPTQFDPQIIQFLNIGQGVPQGPQSNGGIMVDMVMKNIPEQRSCKCFPKLIGCPRDKKHYPGFGDCSSESELACCDDN